jgi:hypothetical protein
MSATKLRDTVLRLALPLAAGLLWLIGRTLRLRLMDPHHVAPQAKPDFSCIYAFWHNQQILSSYVFRGRGIHVLVSRSRDGEYIARIIEWFGFRTVRSSTSQGKVHALRGLTKALRAGFHVAITPDGPRGPVYQAQPGVVYLALLSGESIVPYGAAVAHSWILPSWDGFVIPKPFSKAAIVFGEPIRLNAKMSGEHIQQAVALVEERLKRLQTAAQEACKP